MTWRQQPPPDTSRPRIPTSGRERERERAKYLRKRGVPIRTALPSGGGQADRGKGRRGTEKERASPRRGLPLLPAPPALLGRMNERVCASTTPRSPLQHSDHPEVLVNCSNLQKERPGAGSQASEMQEEEVAAAEEVVVVLEEEEEEEEEKEAKEEEKGKREMR
ncbi:hypothetical protein TREES_T100001524 [Tupaia chinensis]|uniref:Uncharacterized protein n=1 Tax=Tupaia chinensis TaxID=246437 RepID=L9KQ38_TUPCH|nr:hypothetical protein TREES_T100001524 [Tupaia chinensis]